MRFNRKIMTLFIALSALATFAQSGFPPKSYPSSIKVVTDPGVARYWDVNRIMYTGPGKGGHKFRIYGKAAADSRAMNITMFYMLPGNMIVPAGAYFFPEVKQGEPFNFEIVSAFTGSAPKSFLGFLIMDERLEAPEHTLSTGISQTETASLPQSVKKSTENEEIRLTSRPSSTSKTVRPAEHPDSTSHATGMKTTLEDEIRLVQETSSTAADGKSEKEVDIAALIKKGVEKRNENKIYEGKELDTAPEFPGGQAGLIKWLNQHLRYPYMYEKEKITRRVILKFVIDKEGNPCSPATINSVEPDFRREAFRLVEVMPKWTPATVNGQPVSSYFIIPLNFKIN